MRKKVGHNFICLTCDGVFPYLDRVHHPIAEKRTSSNRRSKTPIMCQSCFNKTPEAKKWKDKI